MLIGGAMMHLENYVNTKYTEKMILNVFKVSGCNLNVAKINRLQPLTLNKIVNSMYLFFKCINSAASIYQNKFMIASQNYTGS